VKDWAGLSKECGAGLCVDYNENELAFGQGQAG
jgi:hypothetical protein